MNILVTGYSYYNRYWYNPSGEIARLLDNTEIDGLRIKGVVLPVSLVTVKSTLPKVIEEYKPRLILGVGLNPSTRFLDVELVAVNRVHFTEPDIDGVKVEYSEILPGESFTVYTTLPIEKILEECARKRGYPIRPSLRIGLYLCNVAAYIIMKYGNEWKVPAGFVHIPPSTTNLLRQETQYGIPLEEILNAVKCIIEVSIPQPSQHAK